MSVNESRRSFLRKSGLALGIGVAAAFGAEPPEVQAQQYHPVPNPGTPCRQQQPPPPPHGQCPPPPPPHGHCPPPPGPRCYPPPPRPEPGSECDLGRGIGELIGRIIGG